MKAYKTLVKKVLQDGGRISVWNEEWLVKQSTDYETIIDHIESVEDCELRIRLPEKNLFYWVYIMPYLEDDETVVDYAGEYIARILATA